MLVPFRALRGRFRDRTPAGVLFLSVLLSLPASLLVAACGGSEFSSASGSDGAAPQNGGVSSAGGASAGGRASGGAGNTGGTAGRGNGGRTGKGGSDAGAGGTTSSGGQGGPGGTSSGGGSASGGHSGGSASGGTAGSGGATANDGSAGTPDADTTLTSCPANPPSLSARCKNGLSCSYGTDPRTSCRSVYQCNGSSFIVSAPRCTAIPSCLALNPPPKVGAGCASASAWCEFSDHLTCACVPCLTAMCATAGTWNCAPPPPSPCPPVAPNSGQPCDSSVTPTCSYGFCYSPTLASASCVNGTWTWQGIACAT